MGEDEITRFLSLNIIILVVLIGGLIFFIFEFRRKIILNQKEKSMLNEQHTEELFITKDEMQRKTMEDIGRELHDNIGQKLTLASLYAQQLEYEKKYPAIGERIATIGNIINESLFELRSLSKKLTSHDIEQHDLVSLIGQECNAVNTLGHCSVDFIHDIKSVEVSTNVKRILVRIIQEFIQNSLKHAACTCIKVNIEEITKGLQITAQDNGKGFNPAEVHSGIGLVNIKKRALLIGATISLNSTPGSGTYLQLFIPADKINI